VSYRVDAVVSSLSPDFEAAYAALDAEFGPRGELERREVVARWLDEQARAGEGEGDLRRTYHLLVARDTHGALAGVRDCHVVLDADRLVAIVYLAHALVLPPFRRTGLGARWRREPIGLAAKAIAAAGLDAAQVDVVLAAEMEPAVPDDEASVVRLVAYGKEGFAAIAPAALPYCQPDFRALSASSEAIPIPLLAVVRHLGHEGASALPARLARAFVRHLYAVFATHVRPDHLAALERRTLGVLDACTLDEVPLLPLPRATDDRALLLPLTRAAVLPFFCAPEEHR
jgi:hypothetical protein